MSAQSNGSLLTAWPAPTTPKVVAREASAVAATSSPRRARLHRSPTAGLCALVAAVGVTLAMTASSSARATTLDRALSATHASGAVRFDTVFDGPAGDHSYSGTIDLKSEVVQFDVRRPELDVMEPLSAAAAPAAFLDIRRDVLYVNSHVGTPADAPSTWARLNLRGDAESPKSVVHVLGAGMDNDPFAPLDLLRSAENEHGLGRSAISDATTANEYTFDVGLDAALRSVGSSIEEIGWANTGAPSPLVRVHIWIDDQDVVRQLQFEVSRGTETTRYVAHYTRQDAVPAIQVPAELDEILAP